MKRLIRYLKPYRFRLLAVLVTAVLGTVFAIVSPKLLGNATTILFEGMMKKLKGAPNAAVDFDAILQILLMLGGLYVMSAAFSYIQQLIMAKVAQKTVYHLRKDLNEKLSRLPLQFYDSHTHGEILSRVINDVDNISNTLQQSLTQLITAVVTLAGVVVMMLTISPLMTGIVILTLPLSFLVTTVIASRSQRYFMGQQKALGELNGHVEEMYTGHQIVKAFGREERSIPISTRSTESCMIRGGKPNLSPGSSCL